MQRLVNSYKNTFESSITSNKTTLTLRSSYIYSFQGQRHDNEVYGENNYINFKYRGYNPRLGRFFQVDPLAKEYPANSPYAFSENVVINAVELEGLEKVHVYNKFYDGKTGKMTTKYSHTYIDNRLKENINQVNNFGAKGKVDSRTYKKLDQSVSATIKTGTEYKNDHTQYFDSEKSGPLYTPIDTRSAPDATNYDSWEGSRGADKYIGVIDYIGDKLEYSRIPIVSQVGDAIGMGADLMKSSGDIETKGFKKALPKILVRFGANFAGSSIGKKIDKSEKSEGMKYIKKQAVRKGMDGLKEAAENE